MIRLIQLMFLLFLVNNSYCQNGFIEGEPAIAYWKVGEEKSETVIVLHGGPGVQHEYLRPEFDALSEVANVIYYDQRGCGKSEEAETYKWQEHVKDLKRVIETHSNGEKVFIAGSSWGSMLAMIYAYSYPEDLKGLILTGTVKWLGRQMSDYNSADSIYRPTKIVTVEATEKQFTMNTNEKGEVKIDTIQVTKLLKYYTGRPSSETRRSFKTAPVLDSLGKIVAPVLIFNGTIRNCRFIDWGHIYAEVFPNAELFTINGACHDPWMSDPLQFFKKSNSFIVEISDKERK